MFETFTPREYLKIDVASAFGLDKKLWSERIDWFDKNENNLDNLVNQAKEPALFYAAKQAYYEVINGNPIGHMISLDATSSGLQILAALTGDRSAAQICNVVDTGSREDAYTLVYNEMLTRIGDTAKISREKTKQAIMTALYSSKAVPKAVFGEGLLLDIFYTTLSDLAPGAWELNEAFLDMWNPDALSHDWILPDNFHVKVKVIDRMKETIHVFNQPFDVYTKINEPMPEGRSLGANTIHSIDGMIVREMTRRCDYDKGRVETLRAICKGTPIIDDGVEYVTKNDKMVKILWDHYLQSGFLSARIIDFLDTVNITLVDQKIILELLDSLPQKPFKVISIHDCFRCLPTYGNDLRKQYSTLLALIAKSELLSFLVSQILGRPVNISKLDPNLYKDVYQTNYALS